MRYILFDQFSDVDDVALRFWEELDDTLKDLGYRVALVHYPNLARETRLPTVWTNYDAPWTYSHEKHFFRAQCGHEHDLKRVEMRSKEWGFDLSTSDHAAAVGLGCENYARALVECFDPALVVLWNGYHIQQEFLETIATQRGIPVYYVEKAPLPGWLHFDKSGVLAESAFAKTELDDLPAVSDQEIRSANSVVRNGDTWYEQPPTNGISYQGHDLFEARKLLLFFGQVDEDVQNFRFSPYFQSNAEAWDWFVKVTHNVGSDFLRLGKHHPKSRTSAGQFTSSIEDGFFWSANLSMQDALDTSYAFAGVNSSAMVEALLTEKPVLALGGESIFQNKRVFYRIDPSMNDAAIQRELEEWISHNRKEEHVANFKRCITAFLSKHAVALSASTRSSFGLSMQDLAERLADTASQAPDSCSAFEFREREFAAKSFLSVHNSRSAFMWDLLETRARWESLIRDYSALNEAHAALQSRKRTLVEICKSVISKFSR